MDRFFVQKENVDKNTNTLDIYGEDVKHISRVLRYKEGDKIEVSDGAGNEYICEIFNLEKNKISCNILEISDVKRESNIDIVVYQGIPKGSKMEYILQKLTECGVSEIVLVDTSRSIVNIDSKKSDKKLDRWERIIYEAAKQSKRTIIPKLRGVISFDSAVEELKNMDLSISPYEAEKVNSIKEILNMEKVKNSILDKIEVGSKKRIGVFIGPEGGFEEYENKKLIDSGVYSVSLGPRIFRTETAGVVSASIIQYEYGDIGR